MSTYTWKYDDDEKARKRKQPSAHAKQKVRDAFDADVLADICVRQDFSAYGERVDLIPHPNGRERFYYFKDNGSDILAVAHLDSVQDDGTCSVVETEAGLLAVSGTLDDRLGAYVILDLLPKLGITCDWLLTTDEEIGQSTAGDFETDKDYLWMFQFDRGGTDVVMYDYHTEELANKVKNAGAPVGIGIFSDICDLTHLGCAGFNWGVGYEDYHSPRAHAWLEDTFRMVARFVKFHRANATEAMPYEYYDPFEGDDSWVNYRKDADKLYDDSMRGDCGHMVSLEDDLSYIELPDRRIFCYNCGVVEVIEDDLGVVHLGPGDDDDEPDDDGYRGELPF